ncbi:MAG: hypothetical protein UU72_C0003G0027 [candidate division WWE3 bacterium GW2011_GWB1_41_6]|uniref:SHOCT domain-containing protein n=1 Tax=candidate division WWE3 bacterium GW2011_GWB1_41_6 TaxID=1619112 RepID=A0A0G0Z5I5_UNCKA|nr:MAG: hypothetical protein UU72_C0003G0027 [candidate division WWE3 bacterium GW2011_GWB1_41_6]
MKKLLLIIITFSLIPLLNRISYAQENNHTAREEAEGKVIWERIQSKETSCENLSDENFGALGEYFMGQMVGDSHEAMNTMMERMMGKEGEEQMHIIMGKRLSGCDTSAQVPQSGSGFMPMMWMMGSAGSPQAEGGVYPMMGYGWNGFNTFGWVFMIFFWLLLILGVIALIRYLSKSGPSKEGQTPLDILKARYARGEINQKEFEEMKKDLT